MRHKKAPSEVVARVLDLMAQKRKLTYILREASASTTVVYKIINDYPLWSHYLQAPRKAQEKLN